jgi:hypothetical protein
VIYTIAPSPLDAGLIWTGTDNGLVHLTRDAGKTWQEVTPPGLPEWSMVSLVEASRFDAGTAYAAVDRHQMDDLHPYILRTRDFGHTWEPIVDGIAANAYVHVVREDRERRGLLFAGTERGVYLSFDDGGHWQSLQLDLPAASVRDLAVHGDDLIAATHGRSFWVLDGLAPLRQLDAAAIAAPVHLFAPAAAVRKRRGENRETPLPPETPAGANPPAGALIDYWLGAAPAGEVMLEIADEHGELVRRFASSDPVRQPRGDEPYPTYWLRPAPPLGKRAGLNRFVWDLRYPAPPALHPQASMDAAFGQDTPEEPAGPFVVPGTYQLRLTAAGQAATAKLTVIADPRLRVAAGDLAAQLELSRRIDQALGESHQAVEQLRDLVHQLDERAAALAPAGASAPGSPPPAGSPRQGASLRQGSRPRQGSRSRQGSDTRAGGSDLEGAVAALRRKADELAGHAEPFGDAEESVSATHNHLAGLAVAVGLGDSAPTTQAAAAFAAHLAELDRLLAAFAGLRTTELPALNRRLAAAGLPEVQLAGAAPPPP